MRIERLDRRHENDFREFLSALDANGDTEFFHPHGFSAEATRSIVELASEGIDEYWVGVDGNRIVAYGMLRGWREGYEVPSAGIAVCPTARGLGHSRAMMLHLHDVARARGASRVRLKVDLRNGSAIRLYESLGYVLSPHDENQFVGFRDLRDA